MRILVASRIDPAAIQALRERHEVTVAVGVGQERLHQLVSGAEVLVFRSGVSVSAELLRGAPHLKLLIRAGSGVDNLDIASFQKTGLRLHRIPEPAATAVAELGLTLMLALSRNIVVADQLTRGGCWAKDRLVGHNISGKVLGIVGVGNIGTRLGRLGIGVGMQVIGCVEHPTPERAAEMREHGIRLGLFDEIIEEADVLSVNVPLKDSTHHLINADALSRMKPGALLINLARGGVVDERALYDHLTTDGGLGGAALDVHSREGDGMVSPLADLRNVILTPHIGSQTVETHQEIGRRIVQIVDSLAAGRVPDEMIRAVDGAAGNSVSIS